MDMTKALLAAALAGFTVVAGHVAAQGTPPQTPPAGAPQTPATHWAWRSRPGRGSWRRDLSGAATAAGRSRTDRARQAALRDQLQRLSRVDLRGGVTGGPNLLRSEVVLMDQHGELMLPIVRGARAERGMPALPHARPGRFRHRRIHPQRRWPLRGAREPRPRAMRRRPTRSLEMRSRAKPTSTRSAPVATRPTGDLAGHRHENPRRQGAAEPLGCRRRGRRARRSWRRFGNRVVRSAQGDGDGHAAERGEGARPAGADRQLPVRSAQTTERCARSVATAIARRSSSRIRSRAHKALLGDADRQRHARCDRVPGDTEMTFKNFWLTASLLLAPADPLAQGRGLDPAELLKPLADEWPTYNGDYSGKRYSPLTQINRRP